MELVKSKGMIIFLIVVLGVTLISSINTKKYDEKIKEEHGNEQRICKSLHGAQEY